MYPQCAPLLVGLVQQAEQQQEASQKQLALAKRKLVAEAESNRVEKERMLRMQVRCRKRVWLHARDTAIVLQGDQWARLRGGKGVHCLCFELVVQQNCHVVPSLWLRFEAGGAGRGAVFSLRGKRGDVSDPCTLGRVTYTSLLGHC